MQVIKEAWLLRVKCTSDVYMLMQNTTTPKLYVSEASAKSAASYYAEHSNNGLLIHEPVKAFLVVDDSTDQIEIPF